MTTIQNGFLLIADITGYTAFLKESELEHARDSLRALLSLLVDEIKLPLRLSRLEGDSVISYALEESFVRGQALLEIVESCYVAFKRAIELMVINTTCSCNACRNIPNLDLKFFIHYGSYALEPLHTYTELIGTDVNLIHRLTKNHVTEETGWRAYAVYTQAAIEAMDLHQFAADLPRLTERYEHIGSIEIRVQEMHEVWERERDRNRITVPVEEAMMLDEDCFPVPPAQLWSYLMVPEYRAVYANADSAALENTPQGRVGKGSIFQCMHGERVNPQTIVDWQPLEQQTILQDYGMGLSNLITFHLSPDEGATRMQLRIGPVRHENPRLNTRLFGWIWNLLFRAIWPILHSKGVEKLRKKIQQDQATGVTPGGEPVEIDPEAIEKSIAESLASGNASSKTDKRL